MQGAFPTPDKNGDQRDMKDKNPSAVFNRFEHDRSKDDPDNNFIEGQDKGDYIGSVDQVAANILSSPMNGQRRSATGEYESVRSVICEKTRK